VKAATWPWTLLLLHDSRLQQTRPLLLVMHIHTLIYTLIITTKHSLLVAHTYSYTSIHQCGVLKTNAYQGTPSSGPTVPQNSLFLR